jgi:hypothetical protein
MHMVRHKDWIPRLTDYLRVTADLPFVWGRNDCVLWTGGAIMAMTGVNPFQHLTETYHDGCGALLVLRRQERAHSMAAAVAQYASRLGWTAICADELRYGDIAIGSASDKFFSGSLGVSCPIKRCISPSQFGLAVTAPTGLCWRISVEA